LSNYSCVIKAILKLLGWLGADLLQNCIYPAVITLQTLRTKTISSTAFAATLLVLAFAASGLVSPATAQQKFTAKLSGANEVPSVTTPGSGVAIFQVSPDGKSIDYQLNLTNMNSVMAAHIHAGNLGVNGDPIAGLYNPAMTGPATGPINGLLKKGTLTSADLSGSMAGKTISDLINVMKAGGAYVNVHTTDHQNGAVRGQISSGNATSGTADNPSVSTTTPSSPRY
jgi:roadblock/LC7 domain-containing protein